MLYKIFICFGPNEKFIIKNGVQSAKDNLLFYQWPTFSYLPRKDDDDDALPPGMPTDLLPNYASPKFKRGERRNFCLNSQNLLVQKVLGKNRKWLICIWQFFQKCRIMQNFFLSFSLSLSLLAANFAPTTGTCWSPRHDARPSRKRRPSRPRSPQCPPRSPSLGRCRRRGRWTADTSPPPSKQLHVKCVRVCVLKFTERSDL